MKTHCASSSSPSSSRSCSASRRLCANLHVVKTSGGGRAMEALAFPSRVEQVWAGPENGNDYPRYCPTGSSKAIVGLGVFTGDGVPKSLIMTTSRGRRHLRPQDRDRAAGRGLLPWGAQHQRPSHRWFVVVFLVFAIIQIFGINMHSGPVLVGRGAAGHGGAHPVKRYQAVLIDCVIGLGRHTMYAIFSGPPSTPVPLGLRRHRHHLDRAVERDLPRRLGATPLPLRAERAAGHGALVAVLAHRRHPLAGVDLRAGGRDVRRHLGARTADPQFGYFKVPVWR